MKKFRFLIVLILIAASLLSLFACDKKDGDGDTTSGGTTDGGTYPPAPAWPDPVPVEPMSWPEPTGDVEYTKVKVTSDMITSSTPWNNGSDIAAKAFDGNTDTFFDGVESGWIIVDLGERTLIGQLGFAPRSGYEDRLAGAFYGSVDGVKWTIIYPISSAPRSMTRVNYEKFKTVGAFRYIKYQTNDTVCANISEMEIYSAVNIDPSLIKEPDRELYADGTAEDLRIIPETLGMTKLDVTCDDAAVVDNNPSTLASSTSEVKVDLGGEHAVGAIVFITDSSSVGGKFYGVKANGDRDLIWEVTSDSTPVARVSEVIPFGTLKMTGNYTSVVFSVEGNCNLAEIKVYSLSDSATVSLTALPFATDKKGDVNNIALNWGTVLDADSYEVYRASGDGEMSLVYEGKGASWQDYGLDLGDYTYQVRLKYGETSVSSAEVKTSATKMPGDGKLRAMNNQSGTSLYGKGGFFDGERYYSYSVEVTSGVVNVYESSSSDGYGFKDKHVIVPSSAHPDMQSCKIESVKTAYVPSKNTVIIAGHWEKPNGYADGKLFLVTGTPGGEFQLRCIERPLGVEVRDMSIFIDDDGTAYLLAAANKAGVDSGANASTYVFKFKDDLTGIEKVHARMFPEMYREMPNIVKIDGWYYFFTSQTSGWAPSAAAYAVSRTMDEDGWSELRPIGNSSTFGSQSSWIYTIGEGEGTYYLMHAYRWGPAQGIPMSDTMLAPITFADGVAFFDYFPEILYDADKGIMVPVTYGKLLSQDAEVTSTVGTVPDGDTSNAVDGDYNTAFIANGTTWPFSMTIDLGRECDIRNIQISWHIVKGSEAFYCYNIYGSNDGETWDLIKDNSKLTDPPVTKSVGFGSHVFKDTSYRYVKLEVKQPYRWRDNQWNRDIPNEYGEALTWYTPTVYEVRIYGNEK